MDRQLIFRHYWWIALVFGAIAILLSLSYGGTDRLALVGSSVAGALAFCYFVQQQKLAEMNLFKELFSDFNCRYDRMNGDLTEVALRDTGVTSDHRKIIVDYFNLCAEEYLFYKEGYIHRDVWQSWCRGMLWYLEREPFIGIWKQEIATESYYGLSLDDINKGAENNKHKSKPRRSSA